MTPIVALPGSEKPSSAANKGEIFRATGEAMIQAAALSGDSLAARRSVWRAFCSRIEESGVSPLAANPAQLAAWALAHRAGRHPKAHAVRVLTMAADVFDLMMAEGATPLGNNPALLAKARLEEMPVNDPTSFPDRSSRALLTAFLSTGSGGDSLRARDLAIFSLCLGAGATPTAVGLTSVSCLESGLPSGFIHLKSASPTAKRPSEWEAVLLPEAVGALQDWLDLRSGAANEPAFPGRFATPLSRARIFRSVAALVLEAVGPSPAFRACPQTLRNAYFSILMDRGLSREEISRRMGWTLAVQEQARRMELAWLVFSEGIGPA
jgi:hypothetical protein